MKQYMVSVHHTDAGPELTPEETQQMFVDVAALNEEMVAADVWVFAGGLFPSDSATVVRNVNGETVTTDGPYIETKEHLGGFWILKCEDLDAALEWAAKATVACRGPIEVRPFQDDPQ